MIDHIGVDVQRANTDVEVMTYAVWDNGAWTFHASGAAISSPGIQGFRVEAF